MEPIDDSAQIEQKKKMIFSCFLVFFFSYTYTDAPQLNKDPA
jgi:hypothetical protein